LPRPPNAAAAAAAGRGGVGTGVVGPGRSSPTGASKTAVGAALTAMEGGIHRASCGVTTPGCGDDVSSLCSLRLTGHVAVQQPLYHCLTCSVVGQNALCSACATRCHKSRGHEVVFYCNAQGTCDCAVVTPPAHVSAPSMRDGRKHNSTSGCCCLWAPDEV
jgi:hypothetical protein